VFPHRNHISKDGVVFCTLEVNYADACRRLRDNDASLIALRFLKLKFSMLIARLNRIDIKDAAAFVEGMHHNTHLQGLQYVP